MPFWAPLALTATAAVLLAAPVAPALYELKKRHDAAPLPTSRHDGRISNFAEALQSRLEPLRPQLELSRVQRKLSRTRIDDMEVLLVGGDEFDFAPGAMQGVETVMFRDVGLVPAGSMVEADIYSDGTLELGEGAIVRAALAGGDVIMHGNNTVLRWLHARGSIYLGEGSSVHGRLSADQFVQITRQCSFQRLHAPQILTLEINQKSLQHSPSASGLIETNHLCQTDPDSAPVENCGEGFTSSRQRLRVHGDFVLPPGKTLNANVIVTGELRVGRGAHLFGSAKSYKDTVVEEDACVHGSIVSERSIRLGPHSFVTGPLMAEGVIVIARGTCIGTACALTTISAPAVHIAAGCQLHGTVWARERGTVEA